VSLLVYNGLRIDEALACDVTSLTYHRGHQALRSPAKAAAPPPNPGTATEARSRPDGSYRNRPDGSFRGEPVAWRHARRVRRAAWGNGSGATPTPRPRPTQREI